MFFIKKKTEFSYDRFIKKAEDFDAFELKKYEELAEYLKQNKKEIQPKKFGLKLIVISDTHGYLAFDRSRLPSFLDTAGEYDLCIILGDISQYDAEEIARFIPEEKILAVRGNHDSFDVYENIGIKEMSGKTFEYRGVTFAAIEGSFKYKEKTFPSFTQYESLKRFGTLAPCDILITHDCAFECDKTDIAHAGLIGITDYICRKAPSLHIHGHLHKSFVKSYENGTVEKCVYLCECFEI